MNAKQKAAIKRMAADVKRSFEKSDNVGLSTLNYGLKATADVRLALAQEIGAVEISDGPSFLGYLHFTRLPV